MKSSNAAGQTATGTLDLSTEARRMFWLWIGILVLVVVGASVVVGKALSKPAQRQMSRHERMTALKASGALHHRKSNRNT